MFNLIQEKYANKFLLELKINEKPSKSKYKNLELIIILYYIRNFKIFSTDKIKLVINKTR